MSKLTGVVIAKNEELMIKDCLDSLKFCDELLVVDTGSEDLTCSLAKKKGARVVEFESDNFAKIREFATTKVRTTWLLFVDADERVAPELAQEIKATLNSDKRSKTGGYRVLRKNYYFGEHEWPQIEKLERLFKKSALKGWRGELHETAEVEGNIEDLNNYLLHFTHRDLSSMVDKTNLWSEKEAKLRLDASHPPMSWWRFPRVMVMAFYNSYITQKGWRAGTAGLVESIYQAFSIFITYAKLWELQQEKKK